MTFLAPATYPSSINPNLVTNCSTFNAAGWTLFSSVGSTNVPTFGAFQADPFGAADAQQVSFTDPRCGFVQIFSPVLAPNTTYTASLYFRLVTGSPNIYLGYYNGSSPVTQYSTKTVLTGLWQRVVLRFTTGGSDAAPSILVTNANVDGASQGNTGTIALWGMKVELGSQVTTFNGCAVPASGRSFIAAIYTFGTPGNVGGPNSNSTPIHTWLGTQPDYVSDWQGLSGGLGSGFNWAGISNNNYPTVGLIWPGGGGESASTVADYNNATAGTNDTSYNATLATLGGGPIPSPLIYWLDIDREWNFNGNLRLGNGNMDPSLASTWAGAIKHIAALSRVKFPNVKVGACYSVAPGQTGIKAFYDALASTDIDFIGCDFYPGQGGGHTTDQADWTAYYGDASPNTTPSLSFAEPTLGWLIAYAQSRGWKVVIPEVGMGDSGPGYLVFNNFLTVVKNNSATLVGFNYWSPDFVGFGDEHLNDGRAQAYINQIGSILAQNYTGGFFANWTRPTAAQAVAIEAGPAGVPY